MVAGRHRFLTSLRAETVWLAKNGGFLPQPHWSWYSALLMACWSRWSHSGSVCGSVCLICCGTVVCSTHWYNISTGKCKWALTGVLWYASRDKYVSWAVHFAWVRRLLTIFMAASAWPLHLGSWVHLCCDQTLNLWQIQQKMHLGIGGNCQCIGILEFHVLQITPS